jgi:hypothetical protein
MDPLEESEPVRPRFESGETRTAVRRSRREKKSRQRIPTAYRICEATTEGLIYFMVVFTPWAFGTTQEWAIGTMNISAYLLGALMMTKWVIRRREGYEPARWGESPSQREMVVEPAGRRERWTRLSAGILAVLTVVVLGYILVSALNARATYLTGQRRFEYFENIRWLPQTYDLASTWQSFLMYLGLACFFWALRDWLLGRTSGERRNESESTQRTSEAGESTLATEMERTTRERTKSDTSWTMPVRLRRLLWVLCLNGAVLALEAILQRLSETNKLLWLVEPFHNNTFDAQFGPYAYRSNAAQYFNLLWPLCVGFWVTLRQQQLRTARFAGRLGDGSHIVLLPCAVLMAASPVIATSRGGFLIALLNLTLVGAVLFLKMRREHILVRTGILGLLTVIIAFSGYLGWEKLAPRMKAVFTDNMSSRPEIYYNARPIADDFPVFGSGAGSFGSLYQLYRETPGQTWAGYVHDDWLETRITFGWVGLALIIVMLLLVFARALGAGGIHLPREFLWFVWLGMTGCLIHAKFDFPFQIYSVLFLFLILSAVAFTVTPTARS